MKVLALCGALHAVSANRRALSIAFEVAPNGVEVTIDTLLGTLPLFNPDLERQQPHPQVAALRAAVTQSDALLIACPEYGFSLPGVLKNAIDWLIGTGELENKLVATTAVVAGPGRGQRGLDALHIPLGAVSARVFGRVPIVIPRGDDPVQNASLRSELHRLLEVLLTEHRRGAAASEH
jgi:chromate reductase, NAD(P)H dehydrogenase (quinone)